MSDFVEGDCKETLFIAERTHFIPPIELVRIGFEVYGITGQGHFTVGTDPVKVIFLYTWENFSDFLANYSVSLKACHFLEGFVYLQECVVHWNTFIVGDDLMISVSMR